MRQKVSDYIADFLAGREITEIFTVVGGGAMHLNHSFGHHPRLHCLYNHHEQASAMAAECYARVRGQIAVACVTSGPGALNALNGVVGAYQDSIPMLVISGQAKRDLSIHGCGGKIRSIGGQEVDIVPAVRQNMTKYAVTVMEPERIRYELEKALYLARDGRPGPSWLDIPLDVQGTFVETDTLDGYVPPAICGETDLAETARRVLARLKTAERPVLYAGNGIRWSGGMELFRRLCSALDIPVVTCWDSIDLIATDDAHYCGRGGNMGDRAGNFAVQNSDFLLCIGARMNIYQVGWNTATWARAAYVAMVDIDPLELSKPILRVDFPICADAAEFMEALFAAAEGETFSHRAWCDQCTMWKAAYPVVQDRHKAPQCPANVYAFIDRLSRRLPENALTVVANGSASVVGSQAFYIEAGDRFLMNCAISSMGYALPAAIGACIANDRKRVVCIEGDGSIMMNLQELQTVVTNRLPICIFIINNNGYHQIRQTQNNVFQGGLVGVGSESGDLGFPSFEKIAAAFGIPYESVHSNDELTETIERVLRSETYMICEVFVSTDQIFEPKSATKRLPDGRLFSPPLEDMAPFLPREELARNMYIPLVPEDEGL
ncbi:thiamine pyrophosphate-binding protein [uncultured Selenomonas sp.]|uniref:thiamine pyrophosphate-binding protein n=1 Tax=uncultured Selenomonas sp. TaxID=159275 RepID=UPI002589B51A|nr:thiamine pyrophosphate-binding protein [uncultured Selenomonas sp.]